MPSSENRTRENEFATSDLAFALNIIARGLDMVAEATGDARPRHAARALRSETPRGRPLKDTANALGEIQSLAIELGDEDEAVRRVALSVPANKRDAAKKLWRRHLKKIRTK